MIIGLGAAAPLSTLMVAVALVGVVVKAAGRVTTVTVGEVELAPLPTSDSVAPVLDVRLTAGVNLDPTKANKRQCGS